MRFDKFTIKSQELIQGAQQLASQLGHQQMEPEHLLKTMLEQRDGITRAIFQKLGASPEAASIFRRLPSRYLTKHLKKPPT